ncbi:ISXoo14 transposase [Neorhizobium galegae bv. orientalis]|nr:ISXoo14 transposase [Neorhizobium galegae bv. orientalis]
MEQMGYNLLFRWFVGLGVDDPTWVPTVFSKNRDRLLTAEIARTFLAAILAHRKVAPLLSDDHFSVDGTLVKAWASVKSFQPKSEVAPSGDGGDHDDPSPLPTAASELSIETQVKPTTTMTAAKAPDTNAAVDFRGHKRSNATHASVTNPEARLYKKSSGAGAILRFMGHALMENRHGFVVQAELTKADGHSERSAALDMIHRHSPGSSRRLTLGADKAYDSADFVEDLRQACVTPHVAQRARSSAIDGRTTHHPGYATSKRCRKKIEETFGWVKTVGPMAQTMLRGVERVSAQFTLTMAACNLASMPRLIDA